MVNPMYMKNIPDRFRLGLLGRRVSCWGIAVLSSACLAAQEVVVSDFECGLQGWEVALGKAEPVSDEGAYRGKSAKLSPGTTFRLKVALQPSSAYELAVRMKTESGADNVTLQTTGLGKNNISISTALAAWTEFKKPFHNFGRAKGGRGGSDV